MTTKVPALTRRDAMALTSGALLAAAVAVTQDASAAESAAAKGGSKGKGGSKAIQRFARTPSAPGIPLISGAVVHGDTVYVSGMTADLLLPPDKLGDVKEQTRQALARIDALLAQAGTSKSNLLTAQVYLTDMNNFFSHNDAWNEWVDPDGLPSRACLLSPQLAAPGLLVEIMVTAALKA